LVEVDAKGGGAGFRGRRIKVVFVFGGVIFLIFGLKKTGW
jgi:hypothetical protein